MPFKKVDEVERVKKEIEENSEYAEEFKRAEKEYDDAKRSLRYMKIWKAELHLNYNTDDKWQTYFNFELQDEDYEENSMFNKWIHFERWIAHEIPKEMQIQNCGYSGLKVIQGFDHDLTDEELELLDARMRNALKKYLEYEKEEYMKIYSEKVNSI